MERRKHQGDGSAMRVCDNVRLCESERVHECNDAIGSRKKPRVNALDSL
jgi:hypothetical protein